MSDPSPPDRGGQPLVSLVIPVLDELENVDALIARFGEIEADNPGHTFELVLVDDGSTDGTAAAFEAAFPPEGRLAVVRLARNFGSHYAISAGFRHARGRCAIVIGADLQEPVSLIGELLDGWHAGHEIVWGIRGDRAKVGLFTKVTSHAFSALFHRFADIKSYPAEGPSGVLCDRAVLDVVLTMPEHNRNLYGLIAWSGFAQSRVEYAQLPRHAGHTKWTRSKLAKLAIDSFIQFSTMPVRLMTWLGMIVASIGFAYAFVLVVLGATGTSAPEGWTTVVVVVLIVGGLQLMTLGVLGAYLWRTIEETRGRPLFIVREVTESAGRRAAEGSRP